MASVQEVAKMIRDGSISFERNHYALSLLHGIIQAQHCGYDKITAIEFGVGQGGGLLSLVNAAECFRKLFNIEIEVFGFDTCTGLPEIKDFRDHPEIWDQGGFKTSNVDDLVSKLPEWAKLIVGDIKQTLPEFIKTFQKSDSKLAFASIDVDLYSSTVPTLKIFEMPPEFYVPAVPIYLDDVNWLITFSKYAGEQLAVEEFNQRKEFRKIESKENFNIENFYVCHIFDHPVRTGAVKARTHFEIYAKPKGVVHSKADYTI